MHQHGRTLWHSQSGRYKEYENVKITGHFAYFSRKVCLKLTTSNQPYVINVKSTCNTQILTPYNKESCTNIEKPSGTVKEGYMRNTKMLKSQDILRISRVMSFWSWRFFPHMFSMERPISEFFSANFLRLSEVIKGCKLKTKYVS